MTPNQLQLIVAPTDPATRLDRWLAAALPDRSRSEIQRWIEQGLVQVDDTLARASLKTASGMKVTVEVPASAPVDALLPQATPLAIVYEDDDLLVIDKPAGMVVHPAPGHPDGTLVNAVLHHCPDLEGVGGERRPGIVHRLDKETSGLIVVAKNDRAHRYLQAQFKARTVYKEYVALVEGRLTPARGRIEAPIGRHPTDRKRQAVLAPDPITGSAHGREAVTEYRVEGVYTGHIDGGNIAVANFTLVRAVLHTGRTHQIRVHFAWLHHPVVGDIVYGHRIPRLSLARHFLHAQRLRLQLPATGELREFVAPLPDELEAVLAQLGSAERGVRNAE